MPTFCLILGVVVFAAFAIGGDSADGLKSFGVMAVLAVLFLFSSRSETVSGLSAALGATSAGR